MKQIFTTCIYCGRRMYDSKQNCCCRERFELVMVNDNNADEIPHLLKIGTRPECISEWQDRTRAYKDVDYMGFPFNVDVKEIGECRLSVPGKKWAGLKLIVRIRK